MDSNLNTKLWSELQSPASQSSKSFNIIIVILEIQGSLLCASSFRGLSGYRSKTQARWEEGVRKTPHDLSHSLHASPGHGTSPTKFSDKVLHIPLQHRMLSLSVEELGSNMFALEKSYATDERHGAGGKDFSYTGRSWEQTPLTSTE